MSTKGRKKERERQRERARERGAARKQESKLKQVPFKSETFFPFDSRYKCFQDQVIASA